ncbi:MAG: DUF2461 domain-containing protein, partial [Leptospira sp.]|nr:DUF2461 domain-containing protein [Leptospira sp.]
MNILKSSVEFLKKLKKNNNKQWFDQNREEYENAKQDFRVFTEKLIGETGKFDRQIAKLTARECIFRINRDIRFSKDKSPYKTNFGTFLVMGGKKSGFAGYYFHLEPGNESFSGGGIHTPSPEVLLKIRQKIAGNSETLHEILNNKIFAKSFGGVSGEKLKTVPKGFSKDQK